MIDNKFNNYNLTDAEVSKIIKQFGKLIREKSFVLGKYNEDCEQEIKLQLYKTLTKKRKNKII